MKKKVGNAVIRNKIKRQLRELFKSKAINMAGLTIVTIVSRNEAMLEPSYKSLSGNIDSFTDYIAKI